MTSEELYNRLFEFAKECLDLIRITPTNLYNQEYSKQLVRSSASPAANYIEAIEASSKKEFTHRLKICRKEAKESVHWLTLIQYANRESRPIKEESQRLIKEAQEIIRILTASILTSEKNQKSEMEKVKLKLINLK